VTAVQRIFVKRYGDFDIDLDGVGKTIRITNVSKYFEGFFIDGINLEKKITIFDFFSSFKIPKNRDGGSVIQEIKK